MALAEIGNLATTLLNQLLAQDHNASSDTPAVLNAPTTSANVLPQDRFTPSAQENSAQTAAQQAGLFQVTQFSTLSVAVDIAQTRPAPPPAGQNPAPAQVLQPLAAPATLQAGPRIAAPTTAATTAAAVQDQLQALNIALAALGLSKSDIQSLDRVASIIKDFNPVAYRNLVFQLQTLAQQAALQAAANAANSAPATTGASAGGAAFQIEELTIHFSGLQGAAAAGTANGNNSNQQGASGATAQFSAFSLQVEEVRLTLTNNNGQTVQVHAPRQNAGTATGVQSAIQTKAVAA